VNDPAWTVLVVTFVLVGGLIGSFLNVVIARVPAGLSVVTPRSRCPRCLTPIAWYDNVPLLSWLLLRARCRACGAPIAWRYPLVEVAGMLAAWLALQQEGPTPRALAQFTFVAFLVALAVIDLDTWLLPHALTWPLLALGLGAAALGWAPAPSLASSALGAALGFGGFAAVSLVGSRLLRKEALGFGDVFLLGGLGAWLGAGALLPVILLASVQGSVVGVALILLGRSQPGPEAAGEGAPPAEGGEAPWVPPRHAVPFGPFLVAGALEWLWLGGPLAAAVPLLGIFR
jgi:leader peptidase (prepilin peptidase)/N-methyltransferase